MADNDPFAAMGGGVQRNGGWIPRNMLSPEELDAYDQQQAGGGAPAPPPPPGAPAAPPPPPPAQAPAPTAGQDPFAASGGGVFRNGGWLPRDVLSAEELAAYDRGGGAAAPDGTRPSAPGMAPPPVPGPWPTPVPGAPPAPATTPIQEQGQNSQTYSQTPGSTPTNATTNQGTQDVLRNTYLERATQPKTIDANDPNVRAQTDVFAGQQDRQRRQYLSEMAEKASAKGLGDSGALDAERRFASERAGQATGAFEAQLVGKEIENRRAEINDALQNLKGMLSGDQVNALQREMAELDAAMKKLGIEAGVGTAASEIALKRELGLGGLNTDLMRLLMQDRHFADTMGFNVADREQFYNNAAMQSLLR